MEFNSIYFFPRFLYFCRLEIINRFNDINHIDRITDDVYNVFQRLISHISILTPSRECMVFEVYQHYAFSRRSLANLLALASVNRWYPFFKRHSDTSICHPSYKSIYFSSISASFFSLFLR